MQPKSISVIKDDRVKTLSPAQKTFNRLIKQIEQERKNLCAWQDMISKYERKYQTEFKSVYDKFNEKRILFVELLDKLASKEKFTKIQQRKISEIIRNILSQILPETDRDDLKAIYDRHNDISFDEETEMQEIEMRDMAKAFFGVELNDDVDLKSPDDIIKNLFEKMKAQEELESPKKEREKSAKALQKEAKAEQEAQAVKQSIKEIFRKLATALHPDKELDEIEKQRKHGLMQRVNVAYKNEDFKVDPKVNTTKCLV